MKVLVTGATGFVGSHIVRCLLNTNHDVRVLVRSRTALEELYANLEISIPEVYEGDVCDAALTRHALAGCEAVVHAASANENHSADVLESVNVSGTENVLGQAVDLQLQSIIYVSCLAVILDKNPKEVVAGAPLAKLKTAWGRSKVNAEMIARQLFQQGAPIATIYPSQIMGPDDPGVSKVHQDCLDQLSNGFNLYTEEGAESGTQHIDVRDLAAFIVAVMENKISGGQIAAGNYLTWSQLANVIDAITGGKLQRQRFDGKQLRKKSKGSSLIASFGKKSKSISLEQATRTTQWPNIKNSKTLQELGIELRPAKESFSDALLSLRKRQLIEPGKCPKLDAKCEI